MNPTWRAWYCFSAVFTFMLMSLCQGKTTILYFLLEHGHTYEAMSVKVDNYCLIETKLEVKQLC